MACESSDLSSLPCSKILHSSDVRKSSALALPVEIAISSTESVSLIWSLFMSRRNPANAPLSCRRTSTEHDLSQEGPFLNMVCSDAGTLNAQRDVRRCSITPGSSTVAGQKRAKVVKHPRCDEPGMESSFAGCPLCLSGTGCLKNGSRVISVEERGPRSKRTGGNIG